MRGVFIAGTDTGVGKTQIGQALLKLWAARGLAPRALKPAETGCPPDAPEDALALRAACGPPYDVLPLDEVCPYRFFMPAAPLVAGDGEAREIEPARIEACVEAARASGSPLLVEAAGGLLVPLWRAGGRIYTNLDLAARLGLPVLLVGRAGLGTINHCALSAMALAQMQVPLVAIVLNQSEPIVDGTVYSNPAMIEALTGVRVIGPASFVLDQAQRGLAMQELLADLIIS